MPDSTGENIFRRTPTVKINSRNIESDARYKTRYNAYVTITSTAGGELPQPGTTFNNTYSTGKPTVALNSVTITEGSDYGSLLQAEVQFTCYTKAEFDRLSKQFLLLRNGNEPVKVNIKFGLIASPFTDAEGEVKDLMIYNFGYQLNADNAYVCTFKAMGSAKLLNEVDISATNVLAEKELKYIDLTQPGVAPDPVLVTTIPQLIKHVAQNRGTTATFDIRSGTVIPDPLGLKGQIIVIDHPNNWNPDTAVGKTIYEILQRIGFYPDDQSKIIYCTLEYLINAINEYIIPKENGELSNKKYICNEKVTKGAYLNGICSADPLSILMVGKTGILGELGDYPGPGNSNPDEYIMVNSGKMPKLTNPVVDSDTYDYSKIFLSYAFLASHIQGYAAVTDNKPEAAADPNDKPADIKFSIGKMLDTIFNKIADATGGAVILTSVLDPNDEKQMLVVPANEYSVDEIKPIRFDPLNGDGITRQCIISCNPASADAYAIAAGDSTLQSATVEATGATPRDTAAKRRLDALREIIKIKRIFMGSNEYSDDQITSLKTQLTKLLHAQKPEEVASGVIPVTAAQWPLSLDITLDGIYGFRFGDVVESTFLPDVYLQGGLSAAFIVQRVVHTIVNNEWTTKLETVCDLVNKV